MDCAALVRAIAAAQQNCGAVLRPAAAVLQVIEELEIYLGLDDLLRRAVELARTRLGVERVSIFLREVSTSTLRGSWGTGRGGETTDERALCFDGEDTLRELQRDHGAERGRWLTIERAPLVSHHGSSSSSVLGEGWLVVTPIRNQRECVGVMFNDSAISHSPIDSVRQEDLAIYCRLLGALIESRQRHACLPTPCHAAGRPSRMVIRAALSLRCKPSLTGGALAARAGSSAGHLARRFKSEMGTSVVEYRNRIRIERFCELLDTTDEGIVATARSVGFGSYSQFHRVFCQVVGMSPRGFVSSRRVRCSSQTTAD